MPRPDGEIVPDEPTENEPETPAPEVEKPKRATKPKPDPKPDPEVKPETPAPEAEPAAAAPVVQAIEVRKRLAVRDESFGAHEVVFKKGDVVRGDRARRLLALHPADVIVLR
jgi:hypothetical protein